MPKAAFDPVSSEEFEKALDTFSKFISADKRMGFWRKHNGKRAWVSEPEKRAQDLLHTFLKGIFGDRVQIFEEIGAGAGRLDLFVQLAGGLSVVVELKMCGVGYSSTYAASGEDQIRHYMANRGTKLGYLVVFDARQVDAGKPLISENVGSETIKEQSVDVRPTVKDEDEKAD